MLLPLDIEIFRHFSDELIKIAEDAGCRATLAGKTGQGQTYLVGGELPSNGPTQTNFVPKIAESSEPNLKQKALDTAVKIREKAQDPVVHALGGAGGGILAGQILTGGRLGSQSGLARLGFRGAAAIGAGLGLATHYGSQHLDEHKRKATMPKLKTAGLATSFSPARKLSAGVQTGSFKNIVHSGGSLQPATVGQKFHVPSVPQ